MSVLPKELGQKVACELWCWRFQVASDLCHHQNHLPGLSSRGWMRADNRAWVMSSRQSPTTMYRSWVWCAECSSMDVRGTLWTNLLPRTKNKATIEVFAGQPNEESVWETTTYCPSTRLVSRSKHDPGFGLGRREKGRRALFSFLRSAPPWCFSRFPLMSPSAGRCPAASARSIVETKKATRGVAFSGVATVAIRVAL